MALHDFDDAYKDWDDDVAVPRVDVNPMYSTKAYNVELHRPKAPAPYRTRLAKVWWELNGPMAVGLGVGLTGAICTGALAGLTALYIGGSAGVLATIAAGIAGVAGPTLAGTTLKEAMEVLRARE